MATSEITMTMFEDPNNPDISGECLPKCFCCGRTPTSSGLRIPLIGSGNQKQEIVNREYIDVDNLDVELNYHLLSQQEEELDNYRGTTWINTHSIICYNENCAMLKVGDNRLYHRQEDAELYWRKRNGFSGSISRKLISNLNKKEIARLLLELMPIEYIESSYRIPEGINVATREMAYREEEFHYRKITDDPVVISAEDAALLRCILAMNFNAGD